VHCDYVTVGPLEVNKQNCMHFAEEHCFGCALALCGCSDKYGYPTAHKTF